MDFSIKNFFYKFNIINGMLKWLVQRQDVDKSYVCVWMDVTCGFYIFIHIVYI